MQLDFLVVTGQRRHLTGPRRSDTSHLPTNATTLLALVLFGASFTGCNAETTTECPVCVTSEGDAGADTESANDASTDVTVPTLPDTTEWRPPTPDEPDTVELPDATDSSIEPGDSDEGAAAGTFGAPCTDNTDCFSGWCVEGPEGFICTEGCDEACPEGYDCKAVAGQADVAFLCMPRLQKLCAPCTTDGHCNGGACLTLDGTSWCGYACSEASDCPTGYVCDGHTDGETEGAWCQPETGSCTCSVDLNGGQRTCDSANDVGTCFGTQTCDQETGWGECNAQTPVVETCDGQDNDCNGLVDDELIGSDECEKTNDFGTCEGSQNCVGDQGWVCDAAEPSEEACNFVDDDCDGALDEGFTAEDGTWSLIEHCGGCGNACSEKFPNGSGYCDTSDEEPTCRIEACDPGFYKASDFHCAVPPDASCSPCTDDGDCFGGLCSELAGDYACVMPCAADEDCIEGYSCVGTGGDEAWCLPVTGSCTCNAQNVGAKRTCISENVTGICYGVETCNGNAGWGDCSATVPDVDLCDGLDNDCDGDIDEGMVEEGTPCDISSDDPAIESTCDGISVCMGEQGAVCQGPTPTVELCDFKDNDCDGVLDEDFKTGDIYTDHDHCGQCYASCSLGFPNATSTACQVDISGIAQCVVTECEDGYIQLNDFQCVPNASSLCQPCTTDQECLGEDAACVPLSDGSYCSTACIDDGDCADAFTCQDVGLDAHQCIPVTNACSCDGSNTDLAVACSVTYTPPNPALPETVCSGQQQCTTDGWGECTTPSEACDGIDNDCDGSLDENFKNDAGQYDSITHCGACNISCFAVIAFKTVPICSTWGFVPTCSYACVEGYVDVDGVADNGCECLPTDGPDLAGDGIDTNCDGVDGEVSQAIFVAKNGDDGAPGTRAEPMLTLQAAVDTAYETGLRDVYVASGVYSENVTLRGGVGLFGGYSADFLQRDTTVYETAILGQAPTDTEPGAVTATSLGVLEDGGDEAILDGFTIFGANAANVAGANSYVVYLMDCGDGVEIRDNRIYGGAGGNGINGTSGEEGLDGVDGTVGSPADDIGNISPDGSRTCINNLDTNAGGAGGSLFCDNGIGISGGAGGASMCPAFGGSPTAGEEGETGMGSTPGVGGNAGWDAQFDTNVKCSTCSLFAGAPDITGAFGSPGADGVDSAGGGGCGDIFGGVENGHWVGSSGGTSDMAKHGSGGGGGGAGAGVAVAGNQCIAATAETASSCCEAHPWGSCTDLLLSTCVCAFDASCCTTAWTQNCINILESECGGDCTDIGGVDLGGSGGGAGSGGCAGTGGDGGGAGGGSFGLFAAWSDNTVPSVPFIESNTIRAGAGGQGGAGGPGGTGGLPGEGSSGGASGAGTTQSWCAAGGGEGGNGGRGGHGGGGGGGCGGASFGLFLWPSSAGDAAVYAEQNVFEPGGKGGTGGAAGSSLGFSGGDGGTGAQGDTNF